MSRLGALTLYALDKRVAIQIHATSISYGSSSSALISEGLRKPATSDLEAPRLQCKFVLPLM